MNKNKLSLLLFVIFIQSCFATNIYGFNLVDSTKDSFGKTKVVIKINSSSDANKEIEKYLRLLFPLISKNAIEEISKEKIINEFHFLESLQPSETYAIFYVPNNYYADRPLILWELNIPEFRSRIYQIYEGDTILIDTWNNVVGKPAEKTYTGHYQAFRIRNYPFWKDPDAPDSIRPTPPGPNNPLGLFVVHYDENSLRYFHGTNKSHLLKNEYRALSKGCVRNENDNIAKMKEFIINKLIKSEDLSNWLGSKKTLSYELKDDEKFPVKIIYKTFDINTDENGEYIIFFKNVYNYSTNSRFSKFDDPSLITLTDLENVLTEFKNECSSYQISDEILIPILKKLISKHKPYQKYYFDKLFTDELLK